MYTKMLVSLFLMSIILFGCKTHENTKYILENREAVAKNAFGIRDLAEGNERELGRIYQEADSRGKSLEETIPQIEQANKKGWFKGFLTKTITFVKREGGKLLEVGTSILTQNWGKAATGLVGIAMAEAMRRKNKQVVVEKDKRKEAHGFVNEIAWLKDDTDIKNKLKDYFGKKKEG